MNSIEQKAEEIITEISMSSKESPWLVIEGNSDNRFFITKELVNNPRPIIAIGWENVIEVVSKVKEEDIHPKVIGFIDRDYREALGINIEHENIVISDYRDLEISLFESEALKKILVELGSETKMPMCSSGEPDIDMIRNKVYSVAEVLGRLRIYSLKERLNIPIKKIELSKCINSNTVELDHDKVINHINAKGQSQISSDDLDKAKSNELPHCITDHRYLCCGHDVVSILGIALKKMWGSNNGNSVSRESMERMLRIGYSSHEFSNTNMFKSLDKLLSS